MANIPNPNDPYRTNPVDDDMRNPTRLDGELQADPELTEGPASGSRIAVYGIGILAVLGVVFYGLNNMAPSDTTKSASQAPVTQQDGTTRAPSPTNNIADSSSKPPVAPGIRDVTPSNNDQPGVTTGMAPARPQAPQSAPTGTEIDSSKGGVPK